MTLLVLLVLLLLSISVTSLQTSKNSYAPSLFCVIAGCVHSNTEIQCHWSCRQPDLEVRRAILAV